MSDFGAKVSHKYSLSSSRKSPYPTQKGFSIRPPLFCGISKTGTQDISHSPLEIPFFFTHSQEMSEFWCLRAISVYCDQHMLRNVLQVLHSELWTSHTDEFIVIYTTNSASLSWQKKPTLIQLDIKMQARSLLIFDIFLGLQRTTAITWQERFSLSRICCVKMLWIHSAAPRESTTFWALWWCALIVG